MILLLTFLSENQRQGPVDRPISTSFYLLKHKDFKGGPLKTKSLTSNPCPFLEKGQPRSGLCLVASRETPRLAGKFPWLVPVVGWVNRLHLWGVQDCLKRCHLTKKCPCFSQLPQYIARPTAPVSPTKDALLGIQLDPPRQMLQCLPEHTFYLCFRTCHLAVIIWLLPASLIWL